jgi:hypothetical protein
MTHTLAACDRWAKLDYAGGGWKDGYPVFHGGYGLQEKDLTGITLFDCNNSSLLEQVRVGRQANASHLSLLTVTAANSYRLWRRLLIPTFVCASSYCSASNFSWLTRVHLQRGSSASRFLFRERSF